MTTTTAFDIAAFARSYETWDLPALLACYDDDVELVQVDRDHGPSAPRVRSGKALFEGMFTHCARAGAVVTIDRELADGDRAAATVTCEFPNGRRVIANCMLELRDGRIVREHEVLLGDPA